MGRRMEMASLALVVSLALLGAGCGGGGGGSSTGGSSQLEQSPTPVPIVPDQPSATPTPLGPVDSENQRTQSSAAGSITLRVESIDILVGETTAFRVFLTDSAGRPVSNKQVAITTDLVVLEPQTIGIGGGIVGTTGADGSFSGSVFSATGGRHFLTVGVTDPSSALNGLSVTLTIVVHAGPAPTSPPRR
jgi:hypothetical protein